MVCEPYFIKPFSNEKTTKYYTKKGNYNPAKIQFNKTVAIRL